jgi:hypothetical protein
MLNNGEHGAEAPLSTLPLIFGISPVIVSRHAVFGQKNIRRYRTAIDFTNIE